MVNAFLGVKQQPFILKIDSSILEALKQAWADINSENTMQT